MKTILVALRLLKKHNTQRRYIRAKKRTFAHTSDSIRIFAFSSTFDNILGIKYLFLNLWCSFFLVERKHDHGNCSFRRILEKFENIPEIRLSFVSIYVLWISSVDTWVQTAYNAPLHCGIRKRAPNEFWNFLTAVIAVFWFLLACSAGLFWVGETLFVLVDSGGLGRVEIVTLKPLRFSLLSPRPLPAPFDSPHFLLSSGSFNMAFSRANCALKENACTAG